MSSINSPPSSPTLAKPTTFLARLGRAAPFIAWPILATSAWLATIMGLLIWWAGFDNGVRYTSGDQSILYVSDVAAEHQALMVAGSSLTALFYAITLFLGRWLRHIRRLPGVMRERERWAGLISVGLGWLGGVFLILLSSVCPSVSQRSMTYLLFYQGAHQPSSCCCTLDMRGPVFGLGRLKRFFPSSRGLLALQVSVASDLSLIFQHQLNFEPHSPDRKHLQRNVWIKGAIIAVEYIGALLFIIL